MNGAHIDYYRKKFAGFLAAKTDMVQHREVIKEVSSSAERTWIYYVTLMVAGLIALLGLLTNSVAVVIGAMLISPLMGPIISSSLAFTIGDLPLARRAFKTIAVSVTLTILASALVAFVSPLKEPTAEILARVRPNIFDLFVAILSGVVGAIALCTKRNYLITSTGVAVATAVIPPLSVTGYAIGTWQPMLALGGFLLFFTNFVAIILSSDLVFFILGFRTSQAETARYSRRTIVAVTSVLLTLISIPLVYTLVADLTRVKEKKRIERVLKRHLNQEQRSRLTGYSQLKQGGGRVLVNASVNAVKLVERETEQRMEQELSRELRRPVEIRLEQVMVASGKELKEHEAREPGGAPFAPAVETPVETGARVARMVAQAEEELAQALAPFPVSGTRLTFAGMGAPIQVTANLRRDYPLGDDERVLLTRQVERVLQLPVRLEIAATAMLPTLTVAGGGELTPESVRGLEIVKRLPDGPSGFHFRIRAPRGSMTEARVLKRYLTRELAVPEGQLSLDRVTGAGSPAGVTLTVVRQQK